MKRREFIRTTTAAGIAGTFPSFSAFASTAASDFFGIHPFIEQHPDAVFIMRTSVDNKYNSALKKTTGEIFAKSVFVEKSQSDAAAFPKSAIVAMKPNLTSYQTSAPTDSKMGIVTDTYFMEGALPVVESSLGPRGLLVRAMIDENREAWFILDCGSSCNVIDKNLAKDLNLEVFGKGKAIGAGGTTDIKFYQAKQLNTRIYLYFLSY